MRIRQRVALLLATAALVVVAGCTQPSAPGAPGATNPPAVNPPTATQAPSVPGRGDY